MNNITSARKTKAKCSIDGCENYVHGRVNGAPLCGKHYQRWWKYGDPKHSKTRYDQCTVNDCLNKPRSMSSPYCEMHYYRLYRNGSMELKKPKETLEHSHGYVLFYAPDHPLTLRHSGAHEYMHRVVFYDYHGKGPFNCNWCGKQVTWDDMHVDHLNSVRDDNRIDNLVASCPTCNQWRGKERMTKTMREKYGTWIEFNGKRKLLAEWAKEIGISRSTLQARLAKGWSIKRALTEPRGKTGPKRTKL